MAKEKEPTFVECLMICISEPQFVAEFNRLTGSSLGKDSRSALDRMIDQATGYDEIIQKNIAKEFETFIDFVYRFVWLTYLAVRKSEKKEK